MFYSINPVFALFRISEGNQFLKISKDNTFDEKEQNKKSQAIRTRATNEERQRENGEREGGEDVKTSTLNRNSPKHVIIVSSKERIKYI